ncbi:hypothetical protein BJF78_04120 [Pseudonocardia sp. CNS-139]|nr:hypothetical protein BJF78_04120 [Pseudonocardia sp. CNS-139]
MSDDVVDRQGPGAVEADNGAEAVVRSPAFRELSAARARLSWTLTGVTLVVYVGYFLVVAYAPAVLSVPLPVFGSTGLLSVLVLFAIAFVLVAVYLRATTRRIVPMQDAVVAGLAGGVRGEDGR